MNRWLAAVLVPLTAIGVWAETFKPTAGMALGYCNGLLYISDPTNPQQYDLAGSINTTVALLAGVEFAAIVYALIGQSVRREDRAQRALDRMRAAVDRVRRLGSHGWAPRLAWESRMYDDLRQVQAASDDPADRRAAIELLLAGRAAFSLRQPYSTVTSALEYNHVHLATS